MMRAWSLSEIQDANTLRPEEWIISFHWQGQWEGVSWDWILLVQKMCWMHGEAGALERLNEGRRIAA